MRRAFYILATALLIVSLSSCASSSRCFRENQLPKEILSIIKQHLQDLQSDPAADYIDSSTMNYYYISIIYIGSSLQDSLIVVSTSAPPMYPVIDRIEVETGNGVISDRLGYYHVKEGVHDYKVIIEKNSKASIKRVKSVLKIKDINENMADIYNDYYRAANWRSVYYESNIDYNLASFFIVNGDQIQYLCKRNIAFGL